MADYCSVERRDDAMPLTRMATMLMLRESASSRLLLVMAAARAVNVVDS